jgi:hypothetical protein
MLEIGGRRLETGDWRLEAGDWGLEMSNPEHETCLCRGFSEGKYQVLDNSRALNKSAQNV